MEKIKWLWCTLKVEGANLVRFVNILKADGVRTKKIKRISPSVLILCVPSSNINYLIAKLKNSCYTITVIQNSIFSRLKLIFHTHIGTILATILCIIAMFVFSQFCFGVNVHIANNELAVQIEKYIKEQNVVFSIKSDVDRKALESAVLSKFNELSLVNISFFGCVLIVNCTEAILPNEINESTGKSIFAKEDGIVNRIHLVSGTALVKVGDVVTRGQELIANYFINRNEEVVECKAEGTIYVKKWFSATVEFCELSIGYSRTGKMNKDTELIFLGQTISVQQTKETFEHFEKLEVVKDLICGICLPIKAKFTYYYETVPIEIKRNFDDEKNDLIFEAKERTKILVQDNLITEEKHTIAKVGDIYFITYYMCIDKITT